MLILAGRFSGHGIGSTGTVSFPCSKGTFEFDMLVLQSFNRLLKDSELHKQGEEYYCLDSEW